ncbi:MAG: tRNA pseudouridine synthase A [Chlamydiia bacterium]|nr:tRNA pseudouridine synthase A [Chlamydiia bacterium]MCH9618400.1 tRNA pseudouridine synthase A [Chlamydiia bacterium]MCH9624282.1 tRNA pseudouridine synthase A [Chlamydiia bacterium]
MLKIKFTATYDGTAYYGWQRQNTKETVQGTIEKFLYKIFQKEILTIGSGRTDRGVHAKRQICTTTLPKKVNLVKLQNSLNSLLPDDISISEMAIAHPDFHPCYSATGKIYRYHISTKKILNPFERHHHFHYPYALDIKLIKEAIPLFIGTKDFSAFANQVGKNCKTPNPVKTIFSITVTEDSGGFSLTFHGSGFLYKMVRNITGALISYGSKRIPFEKLKAILESKNNIHNLFQAPAHGLCLEDVEYSSCGN